MKWFKRTEFEKTLKKLEKELRLPHLNATYMSDYEAQRYFQRLKRIEKSNKIKSKTVN